MLNPLTHRKVLKKGLPGRATIVEMGALNRGATSFNLSMTLQVFVEGITPYEVEDQWMVKAKDTVGLSGSIPVRVDPDEHDKVAIDWDGVRAAYEQEVTARREALASGGMPPGVNISVSDPQVIDLSTNPEAMQQIEQVLGQLGVQAQQGAFGGFSSPSDDTEDDMLSKLERLSALRASGALTEEEFQEQKRRILGD